MSAILVVVAGRRLALMTSCLGLGACDVVWGLSGEPSPCRLDSFDNATTSDEIMAGDHFTVSTGVNRVVVVNVGNILEQPLGGGDPVQLQLGVYTPLSVALAPEGTLLFHSGAIEPPLLQMATRDATGVWTNTDRLPPKGIIAGVPTSADFGPRRVLVKLRAGPPEVQEYEDDGVAWNPIGEPRAIAGIGAPNLTVSGLTMVFTDRDETGQNFVFAANRDSIDDAFGEPTVIRTSEFGMADAQLVGNRCNTMFVNEAGSLKRLDR
jgi:hypothetical protein